MGEVYLGEDTRLGRCVAIKLLPQEFTQDTERLRRFEQEARVISVLNHPNIITIYDMGESEAGRFIVMELIEGQTLRTVKPLPLPLEQFIHISSQITQALEAAHKAGIIHRDIKPENIMIRADNYIKLLDFGLARPLFKNSTLEGLGTFFKTDTGVIMGTMAYMSPEQAQARTLTTASDIFSLGIVLYELITNEHPFDATSSIGYLHNIMLQPPIPPARIDPNVPNWLDSLLLQMLHKEPAQRPTASEIVAILKKSLESPPHNSGLETKALEMSVPLALTKTGSRQLTVGREKELQILRDAFQTVVNDRGLLVAITGEPGLGKTTLIESFLTELQNQPTTNTIIRGHNSERLAGTEAYLPILEMLGQMLQGINRDLVTRLLKRFAPSWYLQVASTALKSVLDNAVAAVSQERLQYELATFLQELSLLQPVVMFLEDIHWSDSAIVDLLNFLASRFSTTRILILVTYRLAEMTLNKHRFLSVKLELQRHSLCREIALEFLTLKHIEQYLNQTFPGNSFPRELAELLLAKTEGHPLFITDLVYYLLDHQLFASQGSWHLTQSVTEISAEIPLSMRSLIDKKVNELNEEDRRLLIAASIQGYDFDSAVVAQALNLDPADIEERLEVLERAHALVKLLEEKEFPDHSLTLRYRFMHSLYQNTFYGLIKANRKVALSNAVAQALQHYHKRELNLVAAQLAHLYATARNFPTSVDYFLMAARHTAQVFAHTEAITLLQHGLKQLDNLAESEEKSQKELMLKLALGFSLSVTKGYADPATAASFTRAYELCQALGDNPQLFPVVWGLSVYHTVKAEYPKAYLLAQQLLTMAESTNNPLHLIGAHYAVGVSHHFAGNLTLSMQHLEKSITLHEKQNFRIYTALYGLDPGIYSRCVCIRTFLLMGKPAKATELLQETLALAEASSNPRNLARAYIFAILFYQFQGQLKEAQEWTQKCLEHCTEHGIFQEHAWMIIIDGWNLVAQKLYNEGITKMQTNMAQLKAQGIECTFSSFFALLAQSLGQAQRYEEAIETIDEGLEMITRTQEYFYQAELYRVKGEILRQQVAHLPLNSALKQAQTQEANNYFDQALAIAKQQEAWGLVALIEQSFSQTCVV